MPDTLPPTRTLLAMVQPEIQEPRSFRRVKPLLWASGGLVASASLAGLGAHYLPSWAVLLRPAGMILALVGLALALIYVLLASIIFGVVLIRATPSLADQFDVVARRDEAFTRELARRYSATDLSRLRRGVAFETKLCARYVTKMTIGGVLAAALTALNPADLFAFAALAPALKAIAPALLLTFALAAAVRHDFETRLLRLDHILGEAEQADKPVPSEDPIPSKEVIPSEEVVQDIGAARMGAHRRA